MPFPPLTPGASSRFPPPRVLRLDGGVVSTNDASTIEASIRSLLGQPLSNGVEWGRLWVVVSGSTDGSDEVVRSLQARDPRIHLVVEPVRRGKARALRRILDLSEADLVVMLNADAQAGPGALRKLLEAGRSLPWPFAVMARPVTPSLPSGTLPDSIQWLWYLHHRLHELSLSTGEGNHLSDELLLVSHSPSVELPGQVINDGAYIGARLRHEGGQLRYIPQAEVLIQVPWSIGDLLRQRTRIRLGHTQIREMTGQRPTTMPQYAFHHPREVLQWFREAPPEIRSRERALLLLMVVELLASVRAWWERGHPRHDPVVWPRLGTVPGARLVGLLQPVEGDGGELEPARFDGRAKASRSPFATPDAVVPPKAHHLEVGPQRQEE